jgi:hypothetical protein
MEALTLHMPLWAILYCGVIFASASGTIMMSKRKDILYIAAEYLSAAFAIMFFAMYYEVTPYPSSIMIAVGMLGFILFQEIWVNRKLYSFLKKGDESPKERQFLLLITTVVFLGFLSPFIWVVVEVFKHFS